MKKIIIRKPYISYYGEDKVRLNSDIRTNDNNPILTGTLYYETQVCYENELCTDRVDAFVLGLLSSAMHQGYDIESSEIMSEKLMYQLETYYIPTLSKQFKDLQPIKINVKTSSSIYPNKGAVVTGNSGGVDSFYSILKYRTSKYKSYQLTHLIYNSVCCEDFDEKRIRNNFKRELISKRKIADSLDLELVEMFTNLYKFYPFPNYIFNYFFTTSYTSCIYAMQGLFSKFYFSSGIRIEDFSMNEKEIADAAYFDWFTVDCISSEHLKVFSSGAEVGRLDKTRFIADNNVVKKYLQVDSIEDNGSRKLNCGICPKCLRTIATLYGIDKLNSYKEIFDTKYFYNNKQKAFAKMMASDHSKEITQEIYELWKTKKKLLPTYYIYYIFYSVFYAAKHFFAKNKRLKTIYYKTGFASWLHKRNGVKTVYDEYFEKYGKINIRE